MEKFGQAKALADEWHWHAKEGARVSKVCAHFQHVKPQDLIKMWESGWNLEGKELSQFEIEALVERWCAVFGELPPDDDVAFPQEPDTPEPEQSEDDTMLRSNDVVRLTGISLSTIKRMVLNGRFPAPMRLSQRRIGWPAREVKAWVEQLDEQRGKRRV